MTLYERKGKKPLAERATKKWATAARIVFAISPNSASCERVFSLLKLMFAEQQLSSLADVIRAALMLRYNKRVLG